MCASTRWPVRRSTGCDIETAALRVFSNAEGAYGANVGMLVDAGAWTDEDEISRDLYEAQVLCLRPARRRREPARLAAKRARRPSISLIRIWTSIELGVTSIDHYFDTLGGMRRAARRAGGRVAPIYIADQTRGEGDGPHAE